MAELKYILEAILMASHEPLSLDKLKEIVAGEKIPPNPPFAKGGIRASDDEMFLKEGIIPSEHVDCERVAPPLQKGAAERSGAGDFRTALKSLQADYQHRGVHLIEQASGYVFQTPKEYAPWLSKLWQIKPPKYSRALLETLAIIVYKQPITRPEIESIRGVAVSSGILKTLLEREWVTIVGQKEVPGRPSLYGTTKAFLDYFHLQRLEDLPEIE